MKKKIERYSVAAIAIICTVLSIADLLGVQERIPWFSNNIASISLGLLGLIGIYLVLEHRSTLERIQESVDTLESKFSDVNAFFGAFRSRDRFSEIALLYRLRGDGKMISANTLVVDRGKVLNLWKDCMTESMRWLAVTYTRQEISWDTAWGDAIAQGMQTERITAGGVIKRVFVLDDMTEFERMRRIIEGHSKIGVDARWILKSELLKNQLVRERIESLGTLDVSIVDDSWILRIFLDPARQYTSSEINRDADLREKAVLVFTEAFAAGNRIKLTDNRKGGARKGTAERTIGQPDGD